MLDILRTHLSETATQELCLALENAHDGFDRIGLDTYEQGFEEILLMKDETDADSTTAYIVDLTRKMQVDILQQHGIVFNTDVSVEILAIAIHSILDLQNYDPVDDITNVLEMSGTSNELLAELLSLTSAVEVDQWLVYLDSVNDFLLAQLKELVSNTPVSDEDTGLTDQHAHHLDLFKRFQHFASDPTVRIMRIIHDGMDVGLPFDTYLSKLGPDLESLPVQAIAEELLATAFLSSDAFNTPQLSIKQILEKYIHNLETVTKVDIAVSNLILRFKP